MQTNNVTQSVNTQSQESYKLGTATEQFTFAFGHGAFHQALHFRAICSELQARGHSTITPRINSSDIAATFDDDATLFAESLGRNNNLLLIMHSRACEILPRMLPKIDLNRIIGAVVLTSGGPHDFRLKTDSAQALPRYKPAFTAGIRPVGDRLDEYDPEVALTTLYQDMPEDKARCASSLLVRQRRPSAHESLSPSLPTDLPVYHLLAEDDAAINNERAELVTRQWLGKDPEYIPGGHTPYLSRPVQLAEILVQKALESAAIRFN